MKRTSTRTLLRYALPLAMAIVVTSSPALAARKPVDHLYGPEPSWEQYRQIAEASIVSTLIDPESARISWVSGIRKGEYKPFLMPRVAGYFACGTINAKNRLGGYTGAHTFIVVVDYDRVLFSDVDNGTTGMVDAQCAQGLRYGVLPPASPAPPAPIIPGARAATGDRSALSSTASGLTLRAMPDGGYVSGVTPGSVAALAGLKPGMVIGSVNGIPLAGMGDAMLKVVDAAGSNASVTIIGGGTLKLGAKR